jgi:hypothetical protein
VFVRAPSGLNQRRLTGLEFFRAFSAADERSMEEQDGAANWRAIEARRE